MIDLHAHVLPGIDDGPPDLHSAIDLARVAVASGIRTMAATPHIDHRHHVAIDELADRRVELNTALASAGIGLHVVAGGEVTATRLLELGSSDLAKIALGGGRWLLLECPFMSGGGTFFDNAVYHAQSMGYDVLLGHPERSDELRRPDRLVDLIDAGAATQVTAAAFTGGFGRSVLKAAFELARRGLISVVASDAHDAYKRSPHLLEHRGAVSKEAFDVWTCAAPLALLEGDALPSVRELRRHHLRSVADRIRGSRAANRS